MQVNLHVKKAHKFCKINKSKRKENMHKYTRYDHFQK